MKATTLDSVRRRLTVVLAALIGFSLQGAGAAEPPSGSDLNKALAKARLEKKAVLLHFTGVGWCNECNDLRVEVLKTPEFKAYAATNFVFVEIALSADQESPLVDRYRVTGWPTLVLLDGEGREIDKVPGYRKGDGPETVIKDIETRRTRVEP